MFHDAREIVSTHKWYENIGKPFFDTAFACCRVRVRVRVSKQWSCEW